ncbi:MAG TPA: hypothetical protein VKB35_03160 [Ktedonobacteraceae bacterium]|nr:hypothetical protein [Ktedonobacteraceae bacterium]
MAARSDQPTHLKRTTRRLLWLIPVLLFRRSLFAGKEPGTRHATVPAE